MKTKNYLLQTLLLITLISFSTLAQNLTPSEAKQKLIDGNKRFASGELHNTDRSMIRVKEVVHGQKPYAVILGCSDSRVPPEIIFDEGIGNLFVIRVAGNIVDEIALGSIEYAAEHLGTPFILVLGHTKCGAVHAAVEGDDYGKNINSIVSKILPAVEKAREMNDNLMDDSVRENVRRVKNELVEDHILHHLISEQKLQIGSGIYHLDTGEVEFLTD